MEHAQKCLLNSIRLHLTTHEWNFYRLHMIGFADPSRSQNNIFECAQLNHEFQMSLGKMFYSNQVLALLHNDVVKWTRENEGMCVPIFHGQQTRDPKAVAAYNRELENLNRECERARQLQNSNNIAMQNLDRDSMEGIQTEMQAHGNGTGTGTVDTIGTYQYLRDVIEREGGMRTAFEINNVADLFSKASLT